MKCTVNNSILPIFLTFRYINSYVYVWIIQLFLETGYIIIYSVFSTPMSWAEWGDTVANSTHWRICHWFEELFCRLYFSSSEQCCEFTSSSDQI